MKHRHAATNQNPLDQILLSTGNVNRAYLVRDLVFATDEKKLDLFHQTSEPNHIFEGITKKLKEKALDYGADAVINCHFSYEQVLEQESITLKIFAYGTIVQFKPATIGG